MWNRFFQYVLSYVLYLAVSTTAYRTAENPSSFLNRLLSTQSSKPLVIVVNLGDSKTRSVSAEFDDLFNDVAVDDVVIQDDYGLDRYKSEEPVVRENDDTYFLAHLLRNLLSEDSSSSSEDSLEPTKQVLRSALRARCRKVDTCVQKCPPKKPSCPFNCQQVFDDLNLCPPPPPPDPCAKKPRCGKTLPPRWRF